MQLDKMTYLLDKSLRPGSEALHRFDFWTIDSAPGNIVELIVLVVCASVRYDELALCLVEAFGQVLIVGRIVALHSIVGL